MNPLHIKTAIFWANGTTMAYDQRGDEMPQYKGRIRDSGRQILSDAPADAHFYLSSFSGGGVLCYRQEIENLVAQLPQ